MARPTALTPELCERIEHQLEQGVPVTVTAQRVGVAPRTLHSWLAAGRVERRQRPDPLTIAAREPETPTSRTACARPRAACSPWSSAPRSEAPN